MDYYHMSCFRGGRPTGRYTRTKWEGIEIEVLLEKVLIDLKAAEL